MSDQTSEIPRPDHVTAPADLTAPLPVRRRRPTASQVTLALLSLASASFLIGIGIAMVTKPGAGGTVVAEADVGAAGGTVRFDKGQLVFPAGAIDGRAHVVVRRITIDDRLRVMHEDEPIVVEPGRSFGYRFDPSDVTFDEPVEITFRLPSAARNGTVFALRGDEADPLTGTIDPARSTATIRVRDFRFAG